MIIWCGSEESYEVVLLAEQSVRNLAADMLARGLDSIEIPQLWEKQGNLAIVPVAGSLVTGQAGWGRLFGVLGYDDIDSALTEAAMDPDIKSILLDVKSGGGHAAGAQPLADYISQLRTIKPIDAHISTVGASAAYWAASAADRMSIDPMAVTGSIGAVQIHTTNHRQATEAGIDRTVVRSGEFKMLGNVHEPLSEAGRAEMQSNVDDVNAQFEQHVASARGVPVADVQARMGKGRTFLGKRAVDAGLVDKVQTRSQAVAAAKNR